MRSYTYTIEDSAAKTHYWLFNINSGGYYYSTKAIANTELASPYNNTYTGKIVADSFAGVKQSRNKAEMGVIAPDELEFEIENVSGGLSASAFEGYKVEIAHVVSDGTNNEAHGVWAFYIKSCLAAFA